MLIKILGKLLLIGGLLFGIHFFIINSLDISLNIPLFKIYIFNVALSMFVVLLLYLIVKEFSEYVGYAFILLSLVKMALTVVFLWSFLKSDLPNKSKDLINFMIPYFIFLFFETLEVVKLNSKR